MKNTSSSRLFKRVTPLHGFGVAAILSLVLALPINSASASGPGCPSPLGGNSVLCKKGKKGGGGKNKWKNQGNRNRGGNVIRVNSGSNSRGSFIPMVPGGKKIGVSFSKPGLSKPSPQAPHVPDGCMIDPVTGRLVYDTPSGKDPLMKHYGTPASLDPFQQK